MTRWEQPYRLYRHRHMLDVDVFPLKIARHKDGVQMRVIWVTRATRRELALDDVFVPKTTWKDWSAL